VIETGENPVIVVSATSIFITEHGCSASDVVADDGKVYDWDRVILRACLASGRPRRACGWTGIFLWSARDTFEWHDGFGNRSGIYVDCETLERIPKLSAEWFREAARQNAVV